ncbi:hypothetical protein QFC19_004619 [Naganishia cerealis]|uniref:Uncharacterized protein n=1 Tax=Naganishia cerealis TaxID=610337 RepID=A0ACC2VUY3_9TREE|nr:hypothetical protein QFC19_004619 [Naganishia cerealis]
MIRTDPTSAATPSKSQHLLSLLPRSGRSHCLPLSGPVMHDGTVWRGRKRSRSASSEGSSTSPSPDRNAKSWNVASGELKGKESAENSSQRDGLGNPACGQARPGIQQSAHFPIAPGSVGFRPGGVSDEQVALEWHRQNSPFDLIRNTGVALEAGDFEITNHFTRGRAAASPSSLPLTPALTTTSSSSSHIDSKSFSSAPRANRTIKRQRLAPTISSNQPHPSFERSCAEPERQDVRLWEASSGSSVQVWDLASSVARSRRKDVGDTTVHVSAQIDSDNFAGKAGPSEVDDTFVSKVLRNKRVDVAGIRDGSETADTMSNNQYVSSNAFLHDLVSWFGSYHAVSSDDTDKTYAMLGLSFCPAYTTTSKASS